MKDKITDVNIIYSKHDDEIIQHRISRCASISNARIHAKHYVDSIKGQYIRIDISFMQFNGKIWESVESHDDKSLFALLKKEQPL